VLVAAFALGALALACAGVYGLVSVLTEQRTREIGVRIALGARGDQVLALVLRQGAGLVAVGLVVGIAGAATAGPSLRSLLYGVSAVDPLTLVCVAAVLGVVGLAAALVPARRAARMDPTIALRAD
jgi:putative ABC transport system permease protein